MLDQKKLSATKKEKIKEIIDTYDQVCTNNLRKFIKIFGNDSLVIGKENTIKVEGNNYRLIHRIRALLLSIFFGIVTLLYLVFYFF